ncbi:MAG: hypothetical protein ACJZ1Y_03500 [Candidatus Neomarinimicrobiota bacterium]
MDADPLFCEAENGNYHIAVNSPCVGMGMSGINIGALEVGCDDIWFPPTITAIEDMSMDEDSETALQLFADSDQGYNIDFEVNSDTSSVYVYMEEDMLHINLEANWNGVSAITVIAYPDFDDMLSSETSFILTVDPVNDEPVFHNLQAMVGANMEFHIPIHVSDIDMDPLVVSFDQSWEYPEWLSLATNPYALTGIVVEAVSVQFPLNLSDGEIMITETFHLSAQFFNPRITSVTDVPEDQGGRVYVSFLKSFYDTPEAANQSYTILRMDPLEDSSTWVVVASGDAFGDPSYTYEVLTLTDSTESDDGIAEFKVVAAMNEGNFYSSPQLGYSVDNIAPGVPQGLMAMFLEEGIHVSWEVSVDEDFQYFILEKSSDEVFTDPEVFETVDVVYLDEEYTLNENNFYRVAAVDHAGNISEYSDVVDFAVLSTDLEAVPEVFCITPELPKSI